MSLKRPEMREPDSLHLDSPYSWTPANKGRIAEAYERNPDDPVFSEAFDDFVGKVPSMPESKGHFLSVLFMNELTGRKP